MQQGRAVGLSPRQIVGQLKQGLGPGKDSGT
jgi:hypothetical protein